MTNQISLTVEPDIAQQVERLGGQILAVRFSLSYGITPSLFVSYQKEDGDVLTERIRLMTGDEILQWHRRVYESMANTFG